MTVTWRKNIEPRGREIRGERIDSEDSKDARQQQRVNRRHPRGGSGFHTERRAEAMAARERKSNVTGFKEKRDDAERAPLVSRDI